MKRLPEVSKLTQKEAELVIIKGTKEGLIFYLNDDCAFQDVYDDLEEKLASIPSETDEQTVSVIIKLNNRYVTEDQRMLIQNLIEQNNRFKVERFDSEVIGKKQAKQWIESNEMKTISRIVRSGQVLEVEGDLLLIGDVNPGGQVRATGNIYILGNLHGIAHAGIHGDETAVIVASYMNPTQLRIANYISRAPDFDSKGVYMECGYLDTDKNQIVIDRLQVLPYIRKNLRGLGRRMQIG